MCLLHSYAHHAALQILITYTLAVFDVSNVPLQTPLHIFIQQGNKMPADFQGRFMFSDYAKQCTWYFPNTAAGTSTEEHIHHICLRI
jgi:hypothetical protein